MQKEHNDTLAKLNFVLALVECIIDVARNRASPLAAALSESTHTRMNSKMASSPPGIAPSYQILLMMDWVLYLYVMQETAPLVRLSPMPNAEPSNWYCTSVLSNCSHPP